MSGNDIELEAVGDALKLWCDLGFFPNSRGNKAAANLRPKNACGSLLPSLSQYLSTCAAPVTATWHCDSRGG